MSLDRSLKTGGGLVQHRSVLKRAERIAKMMEANKLTDEDNPLGLPKLVCHKPAAGKKSKDPAKQVEEKAAEETTEAG